MTHALPGHVVVIGAGVAGLTVLRELRRLGYAGQLSVVGDEPHLPYDRPPLSKQVLAGTWEPERATLVTQQEWSELDVTAHLGVRATSLTNRPTTVRLSTGTLLEADGVVLATGCRPRRPSFATGVTGGTTGVHTLRTLDDCLHLRAELAPGRPVVIVGGGFLGLEIATAARALGSDVTVLSRGLPLARVLARDVATELVAAHEERGTTIRCDVEVERLVAGPDGRVAEVRLRDGGVLPAYTVLLAVGGEPELDWLAGSGVPMSDGVHCGADGRAVGDIYACGDVASFWNPTLGARVRPEHRMAASEQASVVAHTVMGIPASWDALPFWWSDQGDVRLQGYGLTSTRHDVQLHEGSIAERRCVALHLDGGRVVGAMGWNSVKGLRAARTLIGTVRSTTEDAIVGQL